MVLEVGHHPFMIINVDCDKNSIFFKSFNQLVTSLKDNDLKQSNTEPSSMFASTLYVGFYEHNLYALPSLVYNSQANLIEGPVLTTNESNDQHHIVPFPIGIENMENSTVEQLNPTP